MHFKNRILFSLNRVVALLLLYGALMADSTNLHIPISMIVFGTTWLSLFAFANKDWIERWGRDGL